MNKALDEQEVASSGKGSEKVKRILMRGYADPFTALPPLKAIDDRMIGRNSGNLVFAASTLRTLSVDSNIIDIARRSTLSLPADELNEIYDHLVLPFANAFRPGYSKILDRYSDVIEKLKIPVTVVGIGAQATIDYDWSQLGQIEDQVKRFVRAVLNRGPSIGVRGELTERYLNSLGFRDVVTIGCPSMYYNGDRLRLTVPESLTRNSRVAINLTPRVPMPKDFTVRHLEMFPNTTYIAQDQADLEMMLGGKPVVGDASYPGSLEHPYLRKNKALMYLNAQRWIAEMAEYDFSFGSRIHGNVTALLAGVPCHVIAHDSRTRELAEYFQIPFTPSPALTEETSAYTLFEASDWSALINGHAERFARFVAYLDAHRLAHIHRHPGDGTSAFDRRTAEGTVGDEVKVGVQTTHPSHLLARQIVTARYVHQKLESLSKLSAPRPKPKNAPVHTTNVVRKAAARIKRLKRRLMRER